MQFLLSALNKKGQLFQLAGVLRGIILVSASFPNPLNPAASPLHSFDQINRTQQKTEQTKSEIKDINKIPSNSLIQKKVPSKSYQRIWKFTKLGVSLTFSNSSNFIANKLGISQRVHINQKSAKYLAEELCKLRGAPLKLAQILSIQQQKLISPIIRQAFQKARNQAYCMPFVQLNQILSNQLGSNWQQKFQRFDKKPFAAASIGQVHYGILQKKQVAIKIQYLGVKQSIQNDFWGLTQALKISGALPKTMFAQKLFPSILKELLRQCDYQLQAQLQNGYRQQIKRFKQYQIPEVFSISTKKVLITQFKRGITLKQAQSLNQEQRNHLSYLTLKLTLLQIFKMKAMQTDPNPTNFYYNINKKRLVCLDFGATHLYQQSFKQQYKKLILAGINRQKQIVLNISKQIGFLTGQQNKAMIQAHCQSIFKLGQPFRSIKYDFGSQNITKEIYQKIPIMLKNRLKPPPQQIYSLHRKFSGSFLLCINLKAQLQTKKLFNQIIQLK